MSKKLFQKNFCAIPWTGFELEPNGNVKNCIISKDILGNINSQDIESILKDKKATEIKTAMLENKFPSNCEGCYFQESKRSNSFDNISSRTYYTKQLGKHCSDELFENQNNFDLKHVDLRWSNLCNQACVYCGSLYSSKWAQELNQPIHNRNRNNEQLKQYIFKNIKNLKNIYMAGGEPLLMKENQELLEELIRVNPSCSIRVNTNLSKTDTRVFDLLQNFTDVHWTVSVETIEEEYEYVRYGGKWQDFFDNLNTIKKNKNHKISFNMLYFVLNHRSIFDTIDYFQKSGFHNNSFVAGPMYTPTELNILNYDNGILNQLHKILKDKINDAPGFLLQNSYENLLNYLEQPFDKNVKATYNMLDILDKRRSLNSKKIFTTVYEDLNNED